MTNYPITSATLTIASRAMRGSDAFPDHFRPALVRWLHLLGVLQLRDVRLVTAGGIVPLTTDQICWTGRCAISWMNY